MFIYCYLVSLGKTFSEISVKLKNVPFTNMHLKMLSAFCPRQYVIIKGNLSKMMQCVFQQHRYRGAIGVKVTLITKRYNDRYSIKGWPPLQFLDNSITNIGFFIHLRTTMMTSSNGNIFRVTGHLCGQFTGPRWISRTKASDAELWCFLWFTPE